MVNPAAIREDDEGGTRVLRFTGALTLARIGTLPAQLEALSGRPDKIDLSGIDRIDTIGAWLVHRVARDGDVPVEGADESASRLLEQVSAADQPLKIRPDGRSSFLRLLDHIGLATIRAGSTLLGLVGFLGATLISIGQIIARPRRFRANAVIRQFEVVGLDALPIIGLMSFLINLIGRLTFRELGVLMTAIMVAGRSGSAFAAQIGSMRLAEEVDAMRTIGVSPMEALVVPRVLAGVVMMPLLGFYAAMLALIGGALFCWYSLDIPPVTFIARLREVVPMTDVTQALIKAPVFGLIISIAGCFQGMQVEGNAEQVGLRTTAAVVQSIFLVIVLDAFFAVFFAAIGWI
jgi:phospholipid/cholesterol/gamma-HCH transport system permease protein